jgi:hypothetical protein
MSDLLSTREYLLEHCDACHGSGNTGYPLRLTCAVCSGNGRRLRHTHDAESGIDFEKYGESPFRALLPLQKKLQRAAKLARGLRSPENSVPLAELLDLVEEMGGGHA